MSPFHFVILLRCYLVLSFGTRSSVFPCCLNFHFYFYVSDKLVTYAKLGEVILVGDVLRISAAHSPWSPEVYVLGMPLMLVAWPFILWWVDYFGLSGRHGWSLVQLIARPCLV